MSAPQRCFATVSALWEPYEPCLALRPCPEHDETEEADQ